MAQTPAQKKAAAAKAAANLKASYGFVAMLASKVPAIGKLMQRAVREKWTSERFQMEVASTAWWKNTPPARRQWITQQASDPAGAQRALDTGGQQIRTLAGELGVAAGITTSWAKSIWLEGQLNGFDDQQIRALVFQKLASRVPLDAAGGAFGSTINQAREMAGAYGYVPTDLEGQVRRAATDALWFGAEGQTGLSSWESKLKNYAKSKYAAFADRIEAGETVRDIAQPYVDTYAQVLEVNPQDVGLDDKLLQKWLQGTTEAGKGPVGVPVWQAEQDLRKDARWGYTTNAKQAAAEAATVVGRAFGMIGS